MLVLFTDSDEDITLELVEKLGVKLISMPYIINDVEIKPYETWKTFEHKKFYQSLREGTLPKTCGLSPETYMEYFEPDFKAGNDILYIHFSKAMSGTFNAMNIAVEELKEKYPERKFYTVDTKGITINAFFTILEMVKKYKEGATAEELVAYGTDLAEHVATYFFADTLTFFRHSGRVSNFSGILGNMIGIKPIINMGQDGVMKSIGKAKGRKAALKALIDSMVELGDHIKDYPVIIGHCDCPDLADQLEKMIKDQFGQDTNVIKNIVNPTAGSHCGPDSMGVCFHAIHR